MCLEVFEEVIVWSVPGSGWKGISEVGFKEAFWEHAAAVIPAWSGVPSLYKGTLERWGRRVLLTRCRQQKYMEEESVCFLSLFWLRHYKMKLFFCPPFSLSPSLCMPLLSRNSASELSLLLLLLFHVLWDAIFQDSLAVHSNCRVLWVLKSTSY